MRGCNSFKKYRSAYLWWKAFVDHVSDKKRSGSELLNDEWDNRSTVFFPSNKESYTKTSNSPFFQSKLLQRRHSWYKFTWKSWTGLIYAVERLANQKHQIQTEHACWCARSGILDFHKRCSPAMFTNKKDDSRGDWGSDYRWQHLWNAWDIDVRTVKPRRIPPAPSQ